MNKYVLRKLDKQADQEIEVHNDEQIVLEITIVF